MKTLRIAIFTPSFLPKCSGAEIFHHNLASRLTLAGHEVTVIVPRNVLRQLAGRRLPYKTVGFPSNLWSFLKRWPGFGLWLCRRKLGQLQRRYRFDVWHTVVTYPTGVAFIDWQKRSGVPGLLRSVGDDLSSAQGVGLRRLPNVDRLVRRLVPQVQAAVSLSARMTQDYRALGLEEERIYRLPNAVDLDRFARPVDRQSIRAAHGIGKDVFVFLSVGRNHSQKDFPTLLRACALLQKSTAKDFRLIISGRGSCELSSLVSELGLSDRVHLTQSQAEQSMELPPRSLIELYRSADAFVMSSVLEGFSSALLEAMAAGLPVAVTAAPGIIDFVEETSALTVPVSDPAALAEAMRRLLEDENLRADLARGSTARAQMFSWGSVVDAYVQLYRGLISSRASAQGPRRRENAG